MFIREVRLDGFLSFPPGSPAIPLRALNVIIGANGSGKSNLLEAFALLQAAPTSLSDFIRRTGVREELRWKGTEAAGARTATIEVVAEKVGVFDEAPLRYELGLRSGFVYERLDALDKAFNFARSLYLHNSGKTELRVDDELRPIQVSSQESVFSQRKDLDEYELLTLLGTQFSRIQLMQDWTFGRDTAARHAQQSDLPTDRLLPDSSNLALMMSQLDHQSGRLLRELRRFMPRLERISTPPVGGGGLALFFHERGLLQPIPATRLSDGTIRFIAILATLLSPNPPPLLCIDEPELGLHPDAVTQLAELFVEASARMQLIVTTQSEAFVSALSDRPEDVLVCEYLAGTTLTRLDAASLEHWLSRYRLGEIWRMGELGGNP